MIIWFDHYLTPLLFGRLFHHHQPVQTIYSLWQLASCQETARRGQAAIAFKIPAPAQQDSPEGIHRSFAWVLGAIDMGVRRQFGKTWGLFFSLSNPTGAILSHTPAPGHATMTAYYIIIGLSMVHGVFCVTSDGRLCSFWIYPPWLALAMTIVMTIFSPIFLMKGNPEHRSIWWFNYARLVYFDYSPCRRLFSYLFFIWNAIDHLYQINRASSYILSILQQ